MTPVLAVWLEGRPIPILVSDKGWLGMPQSCLSPGIQILFDFDFDSNHKPNISKDVVILIPIMISIPIAN